MEKIKISKYFSQIYTVQTGESNRMTVAARLAPLDIAKDSKN